MAGEKTTRGALDGLRVVELAEGVAGPFCAKLLADLGADVVKVEPPTGDRSRREGPFPGDVADPEASGLFLFLNTSKRSVTLDLEQEAGRRLFLRLVEGADALIEDRAPGELDRVGLGPARLRELVPGLVVTSITPFGQSGPWRDLRCRHLNLYHVGGQSAFWTPPDGEDRPPPRGPGHLGECDAGLTAAVATLAALRGRDENGHGCHVDLSAQEAMMCLERVDLGLAANTTAPRERPRMVGGLLRARDGWLMITAIQQHQWEGLVRAMGDPEWAHGSDCADEDSRLAHRDEIQPRIEAWAAGLDRDEIYRRCQAEGAPAGPVRTVPEVRDWVQSRERDFFRELDHPVTGPRVYPTAPYRMTRTPWVGRRAPLLGEHDDEILGGELGLEAAAGPGPAVPASASGGPLAGLRVTDFTWAWAGPHGTLLLTMLGAEVIKIESRTRLDHSRLRSLMAGAVAVGPDESPLFHHLNLGKRSLTVDLRREDSRDIVRRLVAVSDVVVQNMRPGVLDRLGLGWGDLSAVKPDLVMLSSSAVGATGPERAYAGYAPTFASLSGAADLTGYPDLSPVPLSGSVDLRVGTASAFAVLAALRHRDRTGEGQHIDLSSTEVMSTLVGELFLDHSLTGVVPERLGNRHPRLAPHGCYPCRGGSWITIAVDGDDEWRALRSIVGDPELEASGFASAAGRRASQDRLDALLAAWTSQRTVEEAAERLQTAGLAALPLLEPRSLLDHPHVAARGLFQPVEHPVIGATRVVGPPWRFDGERPVCSEPAPLLGQHNDYVLREVLGLGGDEIARLEADGALR